MTSCSFRHATVDDVNDIASLHCASWRDAYAAILDAAFLAGPIESDRRALWSERLGMRQERQIVILADTPSLWSAGFICAYRDEDPHWGSLIDNLHVTPTLRGHGLGERLIRRAASAVADGASAASLHLWVFEANQAGLRFYRRLGGEVVESTASEIPAANGATVLRVYWPDIALLVR